MQDDSTTNTNTKSTDFLPVKPGVDGMAAKPAAAPTPTASTASPSVSAAVATPSQHVIDLKNMDAPKSSKDFMVKQNPTEDAAGSPVASPPPAPAPAAPVVKQPVALKVSANKPVEPATPAPIAPAAAATDVSADDQKLKDAMVSTDPLAKSATPASADLKAPGQKKKLPVWAIVGIIVVVVIIIGVGTFMLLNSVSPTA